MLSQGFIITDDYNNKESKEYGFMNIDDVTVKVGTSPSSIHKKLDDGAASEKDKFMGLALFITKL